MSQVQQNVPPQGPQVGQNQQQRQQEQQGGGNFLLKMIMSFFFIQFITNTLFANSSKPPKNSITNLVKEGEKFDAIFSVRNSEQVFEEWTEYNITYAYEDSNFRTKNFTLTYEQLFHMEEDPYMTVTLKSQERYLEIYNETEIIHRKGLTKDQKKKLSEDNELLRENEQKPDQLKFPHYRNKLYVYFVKDTNYYPNTKMLPPPMNTYKILQDKDGLKYEPFIDTTQFWLRDNNHFAFNITEEKNKTVDIELNFDIYWSFKFQMSYSMDKQTKGEAGFGMDAMMGDQIDMLKEILLENSVYYLAITFTVSTLHSVFEWLAMKNDVQFWRNLSSHQGISLQMLKFSLVTDIIVFLYLQNSEETATVILFFSGIEILITIWKIQKTSKIVLKKNRFPFVFIEPKQKVYTITTQNHDKVAVKWMSIALFPFFIGYIIYYFYNQEPDERQDWYTETLEVLVGFIYVFGFIQMTPQLYINYKLKSVDHMPWRTMVYKFLNTIVDDFFAFAISMPWLKRLSCFRDDVIFVIYIYQRWIYKVDSRRTQSGYVQDEVIPYSPENDETKQHGKEEEEQEQSEQEKKNQ